MQYEKELTFLRQALGKCRISTKIISLDDSLATTIDHAFLPIFNKDPEKIVPIRLLVDLVGLHAVYKITDAFSQSYVFFSVSGEDEREVLLIGPYLSRALSPDDILDIVDRMGFSAKEQKLLDRYFMNLPIISEKSHLYVVIDAFCDLAWGGVSYPTIDAKSEQTAPTFLLKKTQDGTGELDETLANMKLMEERYAWENELMRAVAQGQSGKADQLLSMFSESTFEKRTADNLRDMKNYCIIMNTLLRKAAEQGGVHPIYLDSVSSSFALKIEQMDSEEKVPGVMTEILRAYFRLVRRHSLASYSQTVQKVILMIDGDLSADLSLATLAQAQNISKGYLATIFKQETGKTISEFVRERRIKHARHLLATTQLQIQTIAAQCGIMDLQYFSKIFKKMTGKTPKEYRETSK